MGLIMIIVSIILASVLLLALGALVGRSLETHVSAQRSRRLAATQRAINDQVRQLEAAGQLDACQAKLYMNYEIGSL
jgi:hypothetical protein